MPLTLLLSFGVENQQPADDSKIEFKIKVKGVGQECPTHTSSVSPTYRQFAPVSSRMISASRSR